MKRAKTIWRLSELVRTVCTNENEPSMVEWNRCVRSLVHASSLANASGNDAAANTVVDSILDCAESNVQAAIVHTMCRAKLPSEVVQGDPSGSRIRSGLIKSLSAVCLSIECLRLGGARVVSEQQHSVSNSYVYSSHGDELQSEPPEGGWASSSDLLCAFELAMSTPCEYDDVRRLPRLRRRHAEFADGEVTSPDGSAIEIDVEDASKACVDTVAFLYACMLSREQRIDVLRKVFSSVDPVGSYLPDPRSVSNVADQVDAIITAADSTDGMNVFQDMLLSFWLPRHIVGVRNTLLISRRARRMAEIEHSDIVQLAHHAAMQGPLRVWKCGVLINDDEESTASDFLTTGVHSNSTSSFARISSSGEAHRRWKTNDIETEKVCAVLSGLALLTCKSSEDVRTGVAFKGTVDLPFLGNRPKIARSYEFSFEKKIGRLMLYQREWIYYRTTFKGGSAVVDVMMRGVGLEGLQRCAVLFARDVEFR